jgi:tetratricopeptide (TPR) repeat protein
MPAAARALFAGSLALLALRALAAVVPGRYLWGLDLARDVPPFAAVLGLALPLVLHAPPLARRAARLVPRSARAQRALALALAAVLALFMFAHPDRALFIGDASLRHGAFARVEDPEKFAVQAMRGDLLLHHDLPRWVAGHTPWSAETAGRVQGALLALIAALAGWRLAAAAGAKGELALAVAAIAACTGALALDNGYGKASVEVACLTGIVGVGVLRAARATALGDDGAIGVATVGTCVALGLLLHRSALALLPAWAIAVALVVRAGTWRRPAAIAGALAPLVALAIAGPRLLQVMTTFDREHHLEGGVAHTLALGLAPAHLADVAHTLGLLVPLVLLLPLLMLLPPRPPAREALAFALYALPPLALMFVVLPQQGLPRDWDVFALAGVALAAVAAWRVAAVLGAEPRARWLALPLAVSAACPAVQFAALQSDAQRTWARAESILIGPPARDPSERARGLSTMGMMHYGRGDYANALALFERSAEAAPNPRTFVEMGMALSQMERWPEALARYRHAVSLNPDLVTGWRGVAAAASAVGDRGAMLDALHALERLQPDNEALPDMRRWLEANPAPPQH